jgi:serine/threonine protein phosphatase 1
MGDLHGCFAILSTKLASLNFDAYKDRLFSVGDLVDLGPESELSTQLLQRAWFHSVRGNHEQMAIDVYEGYCDRSDYTSNGGAWFLVKTKDEQREYVDAFRQLPIALEVETDNGLVGIVHANCPTDQWLDMHEGLRGENAESFAMVCMWNRSRYNSGSTTSVSGVHEVIVGHTPVKEETIRGNVRYIDTGAVFGNKLTIIQL